MSAPRTPLSAGLAVLALLVVAAVLVGVVLGDVLGADPDAQVAAPDDGARPDGVPVDAVPATVERVVDGDTLRVRLPSATDGSATSVPVRLLNIDTPELARDGQPAECLAEEAATRAATLAPPGSRVWLVADREDRDRFDRLLRGVWSADGVFVNETLVAEGFAAAILVRPNDRFDAAMRAAERVAQRDGLGIWGAACAA